MTKLFCDECKKEVKRLLPTTTLLSVHNGKRTLGVQIKESPDRDYCYACYLQFIRETLDKDEQREKEKVEK